MATFKTTVLKADDMNATGLPVPSAVIDKLGGGKRAKVTVTLQGYTYRSTVAVYGGDFFLPLAAVHREAAGVKAGQPVQVTVELDTAPREVEVVAHLEEAPVRGLERAPDRGVGERAGRRRDERPSRARQGAAHLARERLALRACERARRLPRGERELVGRAEGAHAPRGLGLLGDHSVHRRSCGTHRHTLKRDDGPKRTTAQSPARPSFT